MSLSDDRRGLRRLLFAAPKPVIPLPASTARSPERKKGFASLRGLGCASALEAHAPGAAAASVRSSADWQSKRPRRRRSKKERRGGAVNIGGDLWCAPRIAFAAETSVDCVVAHQPERIFRERTCISRRTGNQDQISSFLDSPPHLDSPFFGHELLAPGHLRYLRGHHRTPGGLEEILMFQSSVLSGAMDVYDRYRDLRLDVDNMSYEELLELGDKIGHVSTGLREEEIIRNLRKVKHSIYDMAARSVSKETESKCSICQEEYGVNDEIGSLKCSHSYHIYCIKQWLLQKNTCPVCKTPVPKT